MELPGVITEAKDQERNFTFRVRAYRKLTPQEMNMNFAIWYRQRDRRRSWRNMTIEVLSSIGAND